MPLRGLQVNRFVWLVPVLCAWVPCMAWSQQAHPKAFADTILTNAHVWTVDDAKPEAEAVAIGGTKILFVGSSKEALAYQGPSTRVPDLHGARVLPGFNNAHTHFENATQWFFEARLIDVNTENAMVERLREAAERVPAGMWITVRQGGVGGAEEERRKFQGARAGVSGCRCCGGGSSRVAEAL